MQLTQSVVSLGELFELLERPLQILFGGQWLSQHLQGAAQVEVEVGVGALLRPGVDEASFGFLQIFSFGLLLSARRGRIEQGFAEMVIAPKLQRLQRNGLTLGFEIQLQVGVSLQVIGGGQAFFPIAKTSSLLDVAIHRVNHGCQVELLLGRLDRHRFLKGFACL